MLSLLRSIVEIIINLVEFVIQFITSFIDFFTHLPQYLSFLFNNITTLPSLVIPFVTASISIYIILFLLGRSTS